MELTNTGFSLKDDSFPLSSEQTDSSAKDSGNHNNSKELLNIINYKRQRIEYHITDFQGTITAMERNIKLAGSSILVTLASMVLVIILYCLSGYAFLFGFVAHIFCIIAFVALVGIEIKNIIKYIIHTHGGLESYAERFHIQPARQTQQYCYNVISHLKEYDARLIQMTQTIESGIDINADAMYNELQAMNVEPENRYHQ
ncbi:MAG: hypothetical protein ACI4EF_01730 [Coprococcus sp.]